jgi:hypothetical protein
VAVNYALRGKLEKAVMNYFKVPFQQLLIDTEEIHKKFHT